MSTNKEMSSTLALQRRHYLITSIVLISAAAALFGIGIPLAYGAQAWPISVPLAVVAVGSPLLLLRTRGKTDTATESHIFMAMFIILFGSVAWLTGGITSPVVYVVIFGAPMGVLQLSNKSSLVWTGLTLLNVIAMAVWEAKGFAIPQYLDAEALGQLSYLLIALVVVMLQLHLMEFQSAFIKQLDSLSQSTVRLARAHEELSQVHRSFNEAATIISGARSKQGLLARMQSHSSKGNQAFRSTRERLDSMFGSQENIAMEVEQLARRSDSISEHLSTINRVSNQLDTMALNAALEAAHARGAGKNFAPLAAAMRRLAESAIAEIKQIRQDIEFISKHAERVDAVLLESAELGAEAYMSLDELSNVFDGALQLFEQSTDAIDKAQNLGMQQLALMSSLVENDTKAATRA